MRSYNKIEKDELDKEQLMEKASKVLGIWLPDYMTEPDIDILKNLRKEGFNGILIRTLWWKNDTFATYLQRMSDNFVNAVNAGFEFFLIDFSQGLGNLGIEKESPNYNFIRVFEAIDYLRLQRFIPDDRVYYYMGEIVESLYEKGFIEYDEIEKLIAFRYSICRGRFFTDATKRNINYISDILKKIDSNNTAYLACSSYYRQEKCWDNVNAIK